MNSVRTFEARGAAAELFRLANTEVLIAGPVGTGKSHACLQKLNACCLKFPGCRWLIARQTRRSLTESVLVEFEQSVLPTGLINLSAGRDHRSSYVYPNGSHVALGGLDDVSRVMSSQYDGIYIPEINEAREEDVEQLTTRLRNGVMPFQQLIADVNPQGSKHWVKRRCDRGQMVMLNSWLQDNPRYHDGKDWTDQGIAYLKTLESLTGHRRRRLVEGIWADPEGARFEGCSRTIQGFSIRDLPGGRIPPHWPRWTSGDYGFSSPYCHLWHTVSPEGVYYTYLEDYASGFEAWQQGERIVRLSPLEDRYQATFLDSSMIVSREKSFGGDPEKGTAAQQYEAAFKADEHKRFGPLKAGHHNHQEEGFKTLHYLLLNDLWKIEYGCVNLWDEIENAVFFLDERTGIRFELVNPNSTKKACPDHALEAAVYALHKRSPIAYPLKDTNIDLERARASGQQERIKDIERRNSNQPARRYLAKRR